MAKTLNDVYTAFLSKLSEDDWLGWNDEDILADWKTIYQSAVPNFKFPRVEIPNPDEVDVDEPTELTNLEVQIIATYMKCEWLNRNILDWENVKPMYDEKDYSPANYLSKLNALLDREEKKAAKLEAKYYRSIDGKPFSYSTKFMG